MAVEHMVTEYDTMLSLAQTYFGDSRRWREIADFNKLDSPYIVVDAAEANAKYGNGYLRITRSSAANGLTLRKGWTFTTKAYAVTNMVKTFAVTEDTELPAGSTIAYVHVTCTSPGVIGNVAPGTVTEVGEELVRENIQFDSVTNEDTFTGGSSKRVVTVGESLLIPVDTIGYVAGEINEAEALTILGGTDLMLGTKGELSIDGYGDVASVEGLDNIMQAVQQRIVTEKGDYQLHPDYGTRLHELNGTPHTPYLERLAHIYILEEMAYEDRIQDFEIVDFASVESNIEISVRFKPLNMGRNVSLALRMRYGALRG